MTDTPSFAKILRGLLRKDKDFLAFISKLCQKFQLDIKIKVDGETIFSNSSFNEIFFYDLSHSDIIYGKLSSNKKEAEFLADLINLSVSREIEKKVIGSEVLGLYREINMIYNFSEMISEKIDGSSIAETALNEATQIIDITHGSVFILDEETGVVQQLARIGSNPNRERNIQNQSSILKELIQKGSASIIPYSLIQNNTALNHLKAVMYAPLKMKHRNLGLIVLGNENEKEFTAAELKLLTTIALQSAAAIESAQLYQKGLRESREREEALQIVHKASQKFVPHQFIESLGKDKLTEVALGDQVEREVTVMFVDIRGFTTLSENMAPTENFFFINSFNKKMGPIVRAHDGFIMQYLGDGFMAIFPNGSENALRAAIEMHKGLEEYNEERNGKGRKPVFIGIGMQNGKLIMGITGDVERMDAAIISDTVNTAARIEGLSKYYGANILLTDLCLNNLKNPKDFNFRYLGPVQVQGKQKSIDLYECIDGDQKDLKKQKLESQSTFKEGMDLYFKREFAMSAVTFQKIVKKNPEDKTAKLLLNRAAHLITQEIDDDWKGVVAMDFK